MHFDDVCYIVYPALDFVVTYVQRVVVYVYELVNGEVKVDKIDFRKPQAQMNES
jgi:vacuolar protein sorting-associated protein 29